LRWLAQSEPPRGPMDVTMVAEILAATADPRALAYIEELRTLQPPEAEALLARWHYGAGELEQAADHLGAAFRAYDSFAWSHRFVFNRSLDLAWKLSTERPALAGGLFAALAQPFAVRALDGQRIATYASIGLATDFTA